jgi:hypothetical protein
MRLKPGKKGKTPTPRKVLLPFVSRGVSKRGGEDRPAPEFVMPLLRSTRSADSVRLVRQIDEHKLPAPRRAVHRNSSRFSPIESALAHSRISLARLGEIVNFQRNLNRATIWRRYKTAPR